MNFDNIKQRMRERIRARAQQKANEIGKPVTVKIEGSGETYTVNPEPKQHD